MIHNINNRKPAARKCTQIQWHIQVNSFSPEPLILKEMRDRKIIGNTQKRAGTTAMNQCHFGIQCFEHLCITTVQPGLKTLSEFKSF